jgi:hypothetical protein
MDAAMACPEFESAKANFVLVGDAGRAILKLRICVGVELHESTNSRGLVPDELFNRDRITRTGVAVYIPNHPGKPDWLVSAATFMSSRNVPAVWFQFIDVMSFIDILSTTLLPVLAPVGITLLGPEPSSTCAPHTYIVAALVVSVSG